VDQIKRVVAGVAALALAAAAAVAMADSRTQAIADRLAPVGEICMAGDECTGGAATVVAAGEPRDPAEIYQTKCFSCHNTGVGGAPKVGDQAAWAPRVEKGMDVLFKNAWEGFNAMPPRGICMDCTEEEMRETVEWMVAEST
jgi:cytochrome c5